MRNPMRSQANDARSTTLHWLGALGLGLALSIQVRAQEEGETVGPPLPELPPQAEDAPGGDARHELIELFHTVERRLEAVDENLAQAGTGVIPLEAPEDSGIDDLLRSAVANSEALTRDIDRMLEIAQELGSMQQQQSQQGQQGQPQQGQQGQSPLDDRPQGGQQDREQTPEGPQDGEGQPNQPDGQEPGEGEDQGEGDDPQQDENGDPNGDDPDGDQDNPDSGSNRPGDDPDSRAGARVAPGTDAERWGELPVRVREVFRNQGREDLPVQYRDWIDAYYRRLNADDR